jgi:hypothetical protein
MRCPKQTDMLSDSMEDGAYRPCTGVRAIFRRSRPSTTRLAVLQGKICTQGRWLHWFTFLGDGAQGRWLPRQHAHGHWSCDGEAAPLV